MLFNFPSLMLVLFYYMLAFLCVYVYIYVCIISEDFSLILLCKFLTVLSFQLSKKISFPHKSDTKLLNFMNSCLLLNKKSQSNKEQLPARRTKSSKELEIITVLILPQILNSLHKKKSPRFFNI